MWTWFRQKRWEPRQFSRQFLSQRRRAWAGSRLGRGGRVPCIHCRHGYSQNNALRVRRSHHSTSAETRKIRVKMSDFCHTIKLSPYLGLKCVVLLWEVLLPVVLGVAPLVSPLECLVCGNINVLEILVRAVGALAGDGQGALGTLGWPGLSGQHCVGISLKLNFILMSLYKKKYYLPFHTEPRPCAWHPIWSLPGGQSWRRCRRDQHGHGPWGRGTRAQVRIEEEGRIRESLSLLFWGGFEDWPRQSLGLNTGKPPSDRN